MAGLLSVGVSGLNAAQYGLQTTEHNVTNANTAGYNRQVIAQGTNIALGTAGGYIGQGTQVTSVSRVYNSFITDQINQSNTSAASLGAYYDQITQIDNLLADSNAGLSPALQDFFKGVQQVASDPSLVSARQSMASSAAALVARFQSLNKRMSDMYSGINGQIKSTVDLINSYSSQIADINGRIIVASSGTKQVPNDLLDQRDQLIADLNKQIRTQVSTESNGSISVFVGNGQQLVVGTTANKMTALPSAADPERIAVGVASANGSVELSEKLVSGGVLGGLVQFRKDSLDPAINSLGKVAASLALTFNAQQALGQDLNGNKSGDASFISDVFQLSKPKSIPNLNNVSTGTLAVNFTPPTFNGTNFQTDLTNNDYKLLSTDGTNFLMTRIPDGKSWGPGDLTALNAIIGAGGTDPQGFQFDTAAALPTGMVAGDSFMIEPTREVGRNIQMSGAIAADPTLIAAATPVLASADTANAGTAQVSVGTVAPGYVIPAAGSPDVFTYDGTNINGPGGSVAYNPQGTSITNNGITIVISGTPQIGDTFSVSANVGGVGDGRNAVLLGQLQTQNTTTGGKATFQSSYAQLVSDVGNKTREVKVTRDAQQTLADQATATRESSSGVNLDEEAANLIKYQTAYQASARMINIGSKLFDVLFNIA
jgi:flagellar hook-associated protein 1 FlgK